MQVNFCCCNCITMYYFTLYIVFGLVQLVLSQSTCPDVQPVKNFNLTAFVGKKWYEIARYNDDFEGDEDCTTMTFNIVKGVVLFDVHSSLKDKIRTFGGSLDLKDGQNGILYYHSKAFGGESDNTIPAVVLDADYNNYAVLYFCMYDPDKKVKTDMAWILSTSKTLAAPAKTAIENLFQAKNILDKSKFFWEAFTNSACKENV